MSYHSEAAKVRDLPNVMKYIMGNILDIGCGPDKITPDAVGVDGRKLEGVDFVTDRIMDLYSDISNNRDRLPYLYDTVFSSHFLEHIPNQYHAIWEWRRLLQHGGHLVLYLPDGDHYNNKDNFEHMVDMKYEPFMFWFRRAFCGEGKDFRGDNMPKMFELVDSGMDIGPDKYSFYVVARKV